MRTSAVGIALMCALIIAGCSKIGDPLSVQLGVPVGLSMTLSQSGGFTGTLGAADSIRIDSAVVVLSRIKFEAHEEGIDSSGAETDGDANTMFRGPFVVHVRDTVSIHFAGQFLPPGTYTAVKVKIHRLQAGEPCQNSDEYNGAGKNPNADTCARGSSIVVWGSMLKEGVWTSFVLKVDDEFEFELAGNFTVPEASGSVSIALNFNMALWFRNPLTGILLDPTDLSQENYTLIRMAVRQSFGSGHGGCDNDHDGRPDP